MNHFLKLLACLAVLALPLTAVAQNKSIKEQADVAFKSGNYEDATKKYNTAAAIASSEAESAALAKLAKKAKEAGKLRDDANNLWERGMYSDAVVKYNELLKLNPEDNLAKKRIEEKDYKAQMDKAMYWYNKKEWSQALACFEKAGSTTDWTQVQLNAYRRCQEENSYATWNRVKDSYTAAGESEALYIVRNFPESYKINEVKDYLFEYYMRSNEYDKATRYAATEAQRSRLASASTEYKKRKAKEERKANQKTSSAFPFDPVWSVAAELDISGSKPLEGALPIEVRLLDADRRFNVSVGGRFSARSMLKGDSITYLDGSNRKKLKGSFHYYQLSPYIKVRFNFSNPATNGKGLFVSGLARLNFNFGYTYTEELSNLNPSGQEVNTQTNKYHPKETLTTLTYTIGGELGYNSKLFELYVFYTYDLTRPVGENSVAEMGINTADPHYRHMSHGSIGKYFAKTGFLGAGLRFYFGK